MLRLLVGLGNPEARYAGTRHNAGFWFADRVADRLQGSFRPVARFSGDVCEVSRGTGSVRLLKPMTHMNRSGWAVAGLARYYRLDPEEILVAHDEIDLPPGTVRLKEGGGDGGHRGLRDVIPSLGSREFLRLRIGVGHPGHRDDVIDYVLRGAPAAERTLIDVALDRALEQLERILEGQLELAMNELHRRPEPAVDTDV